MDLEDLTALDEFYAANITFTDPVHEIHGLEKLKAYFKKLNGNLQSGAFYFDREDSSGQNVYLSWKMVLRLKRPNKTITARGLTFLQLEEKIVCQRAYFDAGEVFYEHIPLLKVVIRAIKKRLN